MPCAPVSASCVCARLGGLVLIPWAWLVLACTPRASEAPPSPPEPAASPVVAAPVVEAPAAAPGASAERPAEAELQANAIYRPAPESEKLRAALAPSLTEAVIMIDYCVSPAGVPEEVHARAGLPEDTAALAEICREAVTRWRYKPFMREGKAVRVCAEARFQVRAP